MKADPAKESESPELPPRRQIRAAFDGTSIRVYQAYSAEIADRALGAKTFKAPFRRERMTWIKPSWTWMMYRSGFASKPGQERVLGIDITREGFEWALGHSCISHYCGAVHESDEAWRASLRTSPVRVQWDPERDARLAPLDWRAIQIGLQGEAMHAYLDEWILRIEDRTALAREMGLAIEQGNTDRARSLVPTENPYPLSPSLAKRIDAS